MAIVEKSTRDGKSALLPAPRANRRAMSHGAYLTVFSAPEQAEIGEIGERIRELVPVDSPSIEPAVAVLASQVWRYRSLVAYIAEHGLHLGGLKDSNQGVCDTGRRRPGGKRGE